MDSALAHAHRKPYASPIAYDTHYLPGLAHYASRTGAGLAGGAMATGGGRGMPSFHAPPTLSQLTSSTAGFGAGSYGLSYQQQQPYAFPPTQASAFPPIAAPSSSHSHSDSFSSSAFSSDETTTSFAASDGIAPAALHTSSASSVESFSPTLGQGEGMQGFAPPAVEAVFQSGARTTSYTHSTYAATSPAYAPAQAFARRPSTASYYTLPSPFQPHTAPPLPQPHPLPPPFAAPLTQAQGGFPSPTQAFTSLIRGPSLPSSEYDSTSGSLSQTTIGHGGGIGGVGGAGRYDLARLPYPPPPPPAQPRALYAPQPPPQQQLGLAPPPPWLAYAAYPPAAPLPSLPSLPSPTARVEKAIPSVSSAAFAPLSEPPATTQRAHKDVPASPGSAGASARPSRAAKEKALRGLRGVDDAVDEVADEDVVDAGEPRRVRKAKAKAKAVRVVDAPEVEEDDSLDPPEPFEPSTSRGQDTAYTPRKRSPTTRPTRRASTGSSASTAAGNSSAAPSPALSPTTAASKLRPALFKSKQAVVDTSQQGKWASSTQFFGPWTAGEGLLNAQGQRVDLAPTIANPSSFAYDPQLDTWLTYRRNFLSLPLSLVLPSSAPLSSLSTSAHSAPVERLEVTLSSATFPTGADVELLQFDTTRSLKDARTLGAQEMRAVPHDAGAGEDDGAGRTVYSSTFTRVQYRHSTANHPSTTGGAPSSSSPSSPSSSPSTSTALAAAANGTGTSDAYFTMRCALSALHADGSRTELGAWESAKVVVRGRSPGNWRKAAAGEGKKGRKGKGKKRAKEEEDDDFDDEILAAGPSSPSRAPKTKRRKSSTSSFAFSSASSASPSSTASPTSPAAPRSAPRFDGAGRTRSAKAARAALGLDGDVA
ncbi:hypothetical protein JCM10207_002591 [Rhodosporidiobolus poonsookiae]